MSFNTYYVIELLKSGEWKPADDCAYSEGLRLAVPEAWARRKGNQGVRVVKYGDEPARVVAEWDSEGDRIV